MIINDQDNNDMKIKVIKDSIYEIENKVNDWFKNNDVEVKYIKSHKEEHTPWHTIVMIFYE
jgi:hypothetical protein